MFTHPQPPAPDPATGVSVAQAPRGTGTLWPRLLKRAAALALLMLGGTALLGNAVYITSDNAVVTAHVASLRSPVAGIVQARIGSVGAPVEAGLRLGEVVNPLADDTAVEAARLKVRRLDADATAMRQLRHRLQAILAELDIRVAQFREAKRRQLGFEAERAARDRAAKSDALQQLIRDMHRMVALTGTVSRATIEQATASVRVAAEQLASLDRQAAAAAAAEDSAAAGVLVDANSGSDVVYSEQRADEVRVRLAELDRSIAATEAERAEASGRERLEAARYQRLRSASVVVPSRGMVWRLGAGPGELVAPGDMLAQTVDCGAAYLAVDVPQDRVADIDLTAPATFRLAGERQKRSGRVIAIMGTPAISGDGASAVAPAVTNRAVASVVIAVAPSANELGACLVGRTARVQLRATRGGWLSVFRRWLPL